MPLAELEIQSRQALGPRGPVLGGHLQALSTSCRAPYEGEEQRVSAPGEESAGGLGPEHFGREEDGPTLGLFKTTRVYDLAGGDEVHVACLYLPLPVS